MGQEEKRRVYFYQQTRDFRCTAQVDPLTHHILSGECPRDRAHQFVLARKETLGRRYIYGGVYPRGVITKNPETCAGRCKHLADGSRGVTAKIVFYSFD